MTSALAAACKESLARARNAVSGWEGALCDVGRAGVGAPQVAQELTRRSYVDGYLRIRRTVPMILRAIEQLDRSNRTQECAFWIDHLKEEAFHDRLMRDDLDRLLGGSLSAAEMLRTVTISPPSAALLGYFEWQIEFGNPGLLIALRLFLEWYVTGLDARQVASVDDVVEGGSQIMRTHRAEDADHVGRCAAYIDAHCRDCAADLCWSIEFVGQCLRDGQLFLARQIVETRA